MFLTPSISAHATSDFNSEPNRPAASTPPRSNPRNAQPLPSESLLKGYKSVEIAHNGSLYKLQATKLGKLILTK